MKKTITRKIPSIVESIKAPLEITINKLVEDNINETVQDFRDEVKFENQKRTSEHVRRWAGYLVKLSNKIKLRPQDGHHIATAMQNLAPEIEVNVSKQNKPTACRLP